MIQRPDRTALTRYWLDYLEALHFALDDTPSQSENIAHLRHEIVVAEKELVRRGLPPHALEQPSYLPEPVVTVEGWRHPDVQALFGRALAETGRKYRDERMVRLGWAHQQVARATARDGTERHSIEPAGLLTLSFRRGDGTR